MVQSGQGLALQACYNDCGDFATEKFETVGTFVLGTDFEGSSSLLDGLVTIDLPDETNQIAIQLKGVGLGAESIMIVDNVEMIASTPGWSN